MLHFFDQWLPYLFIRYGRPLRSFPSLHLNMHRREHRRQSWVGGRNTQILGRMSREVVRPSKDIIISYNVLEYEIRTLSKVVTFQN